MLKEKAKKRPEKQVSKTREPIRPGEYLLLVDFRERTNMAPHTWRQAKLKAAERGINLASKHGRQLYVSTSAWLQMLGLAFTQ